MYFKPNSKCKSKIMKTVTFILMFTSFLMGCSTSYIVTKNGEGDDEKSYKEFNREIKSENVVIEFTKGLETGGMNIHVDTNFAKWHDLKLKETQSVPTGLLKTVVRQNRFLGVLEGIGLGVLAGGALGLLLGFKIFGDDVYSGETGGVAAFVMLVSGGMVGGLVGAISGSINGHKYEYKFVRK